jgi:lactate permease
MYETVAVMIITLLRSGAWRSPAIPAAARRVLMAYVILLGGVLAAEIVIKVAGLSHNWRYLASPALWLFVAAGWYSYGSRDIASTSRAFSPWLRVAPVTGLFILLGILMAISGMATYLAQTLTEAGQAYLFLAPFVGAIGGFITGLNSGANSMFAAAQAEAARALGVETLYFIAAHNVAAAFLLMASPSKVEMALQLAGGVEEEDCRWLQLRVLGVAAIVVFLVAVANCLVPYLVGGQ